MTISLEEESSNEEDTNYITNNEDDTKEKVKNYKVSFDTKENAINVEEEDATSSNLPKQSVNTPPKGSSIQNINDFEGPYKRKLKGFKNVIQ